MKNNKALFALAAFILFLFSVAFALATATPLREREEGEPHKEEEEEAPKVLQEEIHLVHNFIIPPPPGYVISENLKKVIMNEEKRNTD